MNWLILAKTFTDYTRKVRAAICAKAKHATALIASALFIVLSLGLSAQASAEEPLIVTETEIDSGQFLGVMPLAKELEKSFDGHITAGPDSRVITSYGNETDTADTQKVNILVDPYGIVFDTRFGAGVDGITVSLINADTSEPAAVYGDDGISPYPSTIITGSVITDAGGTIYQMPQGGYRFPLAPPGNYKLVLSIPTIKPYESPSVVKTAEIQTLPGSPYSITLGSRGEDFALTAGPPLHIDIPIDALDSSLLLKKQASKNTAAPGDFVQYTLTANNLHENVATLNTQVIDTLPHGFRYQSGSAQIDDIAVADPSISADGSTLTFTLGEIAGGTTRAIRYVTQISAQPAGLAVNTAIAHATGISSNRAKAEIMVIDELMRDHSVLVGQVNFDTEGTITGLPNVRLFLENGTNTITDDRGRYHFEGVSPGTHVLQIDTDTLPENTDIIAANNSRSAGSTLSRFINTQGGTLWREDFTVTPKLDLQGHISRHLNNRVSNDSVTPDDNKQTLATNIQLQHAHSHLVADGMTHPVIAVRLTDKNDEPARPGAIGEFNVNPPYEAQDNSLLHKDLLAGAPQDRKQYTIGENGIALITLKPTTQTGEVKISIPLPKGEKIISANLKPKLRDWILVGFAEGTAGNNTLSGHTDALTGDAARDGSYTDGHISLYAKGQIKGEWLLTLAYDNQKENTNDSLHQTIDPGTFYHVYSDQSTQNYDSASAEKLYIKLEREQFFALFGDFNTGFNDAELSKYTRNLTGIQSRFINERTELLIFASDADQAFVRDEIRGEGLSGPYQLSRAQLMRNSESISIEVRDRTHQDEVLQRTVFTRHVDYDINYDRGTITFRQPVFSTDGDLNHIYIVAEYESYDSQDRRLVWGSRAVVNLNDRTSLGLTHVNEGQVGKETAITGVDVNIQLAKTTHARLEMARSTTLGVTDKAYLAEIEHQTDQYQAKIYTRSQDHSFGLNQISGTSNGHHRTGAEAQLNITDQLNIRGLAFQDDITNTGARRLQTEIEGQYHVKQTSLSLGFKEVRDTQSNGQINTSSLATMSAKQSLFDNHLSVGLKREHALDKAASLDHPGSTAVTADYKISTNAGVFATHEWAEGDMIKTQNTRLGVRSSPWRGSSVSSSVNKDINAGITTSTANTALTQKWLLTKQWSIDAGIEHAKTLSLTGPPLDPTRQTASGAPEDFLSTSVGASFNGPSLTWTGRLEHRAGNITDKWNLGTSAQANSARNISHLVALNFNNSESISGEISEHLDLSYSFAYRPDASRWIILDKLAYIHDRTLSVEQDFISRRIVNVINANRRDGKWQTSLQYGSKFVQETIDQLHHNGYTDLIGVESRYDVTPKWDIGARTSVLRVAKAQQRQHSTGLSVGHNAAKNIWVSLGYNITGFTDADFAATNYTSQGPYIRFSMKFDQSTAASAVKWMNR